MTGGTQEGKARGAFSDERILAPKLLMTMPALYSGTL